VFVNYPNSPIVKKFSVPADEILDAGIHTSWATLREQLSIHQVLTVRLPSPQRKASLTIRRDSKPEEIHRKIYKVLRMPERIIKPIQKWEADSH
jgi:hypothetical protein